MNTFNLVLPPYTIKSSRWNSLSAEQSRLYAAESEARKVALLALLAAISPELSIPDTQAGYRSDISFSKWLDGAVGISLHVGFIESGPMEVVVKNGWRRYTFKRFKVDPKTGAIDPRIVEGLRKLVATAKTLAANEVKHRTDTTDAQERKKAAFAHSLDVVAANGVAWSGQPRPNDTEGSLTVPGHGYATLRVNGGTLRLELGGIPVNKLPEVLAFLATVKEAT